MIGDRIPENDLHWKRYLELLKIMEYCFKPKLFKGHCSVLKLHINEHHSMFKSLHGDSSLSAKFLALARATFTFGTNGMLLDNAI